MAELPTPQPATTRAVFAALERTTRRGKHPRLSASQLGGPCERDLWMSFRWARQPEQFDGRRLSIFRTGEVWEWRLVWMLNEAGLHVQDVDPDTGSQFRILFAGGHASGRTDGLVTNVPEAPKTVHVLEIKSHNDRSFKDLLKKGVAEAKPAHYAQVQLYMHCQGLSRALYVAVNKNTDDLFVDRIEYDAPAAMALVARAERIITTDRAPPCGCPSYLIKHGYGCAAHGEAMPPRTCRSCIHATASLDGDALWGCERWKRDLTIDEQIAGCPQHLFLPDLVPGEQTDFDEERERVTYRMTDGSVWVDGAVG